MNEGVSEGLSEGVRELAANLGNMTFLKIRSHFNITFVYGTRVPMLSSLWCFFTAYKTKNMFCLSLTGRVVVPLGNEGQDAAKGLSKCEADFGSVGIQ